MNMWGIVFTVTTDYMYHFSLISKSARKTDITFTLQLYTGLILMLGVCQVNNSIRTLGGWCQFIYLTLIGFSKMLLFNISSPNKHTNIDHKTILYTRLFFKIIPTCSNTLVLQSFALLWTTRKAPLRWGLSAASSFSK